MQVGAAADSPCVVGRSGRFICTGGGGAPAYTGLSVWHPPVCPEEGPQLWALMALFQVEEIDSRSYFQNSLNSLFFCNLVSRRWRASTSCGSPHRRAPTFEGRGAIRHASAAAERPLKCWATEGSRCCRQVLTEQKRPSSSPASSFMTWTSTL